MSTSEIGQNSDADVIMASVVGAFKAAHPDSVFTPLVEGLSAVPTTAQLKAVASVADLLVGKSAHFEPTPDAELRNYAGQAVIHVIDERGWEV